MKSIPQTCICGKAVMFAENPYETPGATRYWKSQYEKPENSSFAVERKTPSVNRKGKMTVQTSLEYITAVYCSAECGLKDYDRNTRD